MSLFAQMGGTPWVFLGITVIFMGGCAFMTGQGLATTWRPAWQALPYGLLLAAADRFLVFALFEGELLNPLGYGIDATLLMVVALLAFRVTRTRQMTTQYPWLYQRTGPLSWRERS